MQRSGRGSHKVFDQWLARLTKTHLRLQHGKLLTKTRMDNDICSQRVVLSCLSLFLQALRVYVYERGREEEDGLRCVLLCEEIEFVCMKRRERRKTGLDLWM